VQRTYVNATRANCLWCAIAGHLKESLLLQLPFYHINSTMNDGRQLELWFSTKADGRKTFGVEMHESSLEKKGARKAPAAVIKEAEGAFGKPHGQMGRRCRVSALTVQHVKPLYAATGARSDRRLQHPGPGTFPRPCSNSKASTGAASPIDRW
jgi:hypothetical protein